MQVLRCVHPPEGATALSMLMGGPTMHALGVRCVFMPVLLDAAVIVSVAAAFTARLGAVAIQPIRRQAALSGSSPSPYGTAVDGAAVEAADHSSPPWRETTSSSSTILDTLRVASQQTSGDLARGVWPRYIEGFFAFQEVPMRTRLWMGVAASLVTGSLFAACGGDSTAVGNNGGSGGSQGGSAGTAGNGGSGGASGGAAGMGGGAAGMGGGGGSGGEAPARFTAAVSGELLLLTPLDPVWVVRCSNSIQAIQLAGGSWVELRDDRPEGYNGHYAAHFLDDAYQSDCNLNLGCDVTHCAQLEAQSAPEAPWERQQPSTREYVQVGLTPAPACGEEDAGTDGGALDAGDAGGRLVPAIESRAPSGQLGVRVRYFRNSSCSGTALSTDVPVE